MTLYFIISVISFIFQGVAAEEAAVLSRFVIPP